MRSPRLRRLILAPLILVLTACKTPLQASGTSGLGSVSGQVTAPPAQISAIGGFEAYRLSAQPASEFRTSAFAGEVPVGSNVSIQAYTLGGEPLATATARTDAQGKFSLAGLPRDRVSLLKATATGKNGNSLTITGLVRPEGETMVTKVSAASSVVAQGLLKLGVSERVAVMSQVLLDQMVEKLAKVATEAERNPDLTGKTDLSGMFQKLLDRAEALEGIVESLFER